MSRLISLGRGCVGRSAGAAVLLFVAIAGAQAQSVVATNENPAGRIDFAAAKLPAATVEVDLTQGMFGDLFGLGDAAIAGIAESLANSPAAHENSQTAEMAAEKLAVARHIIQLAQDVVTEVRVRVFEPYPESVEPVITGALFEEQLTKERWDKAVRVKEKDATVQVSLLRNEGAIRGVLVVVAEGKSLVLVNLVCDVSPQTVKELSAAAAAIGLEHGLLQEFERRLGGMR